jgi:hypothetical protein
MLHAYVERFDVMGVGGNILGWNGEVNKSIVKNYWLRACLTNTEHPGSPEAARPDPSLNRCLPSTVPTRPCMHRASVVDSSVSLFLPRFRSTAGNETSRKDELVEKGGSKIYFSSRLGLPGTGPFSGWDEKKIVAFVSSFCSVFSTQV